MDTGEYIKLRYRMEQSSNKINHDYYESPYRFLSPKYVEEHLREFGEHTNWETLTNRCVFSKEQLEEYKDMIKWAFYRGKNMTIKMIEEHKDDLDWNLFTRNRVLSKKSLRRWHDRIAWMDLNSDTIRKNLTEEFIREFPYKDYSWYDIMLYRELSPDFIIEFWDKLKEYIYLIDFRRKPYNGHEGLKILRNHG